MTDAHPCLSIARQTDAGAYRLVAWALKGSCSDLSWLGFDDSGEPAEFMAVTAREVD